MRWNKLFKWQHNRGKIILGQLKYVLVNSTFNKKILRRLYEGKKKWENILRKNYFNKGL